MRSLLLAVVLAGCDACGGTVKVKPTEPIRVQRIEVHHHHIHEVRVRKTRTTCTGSLLSREDPLNCETESEEP